MSNVIKYTTTPVNNTIKKGNFALGINDVDYGPSDITGFYMTTIPSTSGYTIYNENGGTLSYESVSGTTPLINYLSNKRGVNMTTAGESLSWAAGQSNIFVTNREYENIVTSGMVLNLDAGFVSSYPTSANTWYDLSYSGNNGTLVNSPTFSSLSGGSIVFDGVDDYVSISGLTLSTYSLNIAFNSSVNDNDRRLIGSMTNAGGAASLTVSVGYVLNTLSVWQESSQWVVISAITTNTNYILSIVSDQVTNTTKCYLNGIFVKTMANSISINSVGIGQPYRFLNGNYFSGKVYTCQMYNRALSESEVQQNFNALRYRFGL